MHLAVRQVFHRWVQQSESAGNRQHTNGTLRRGVLATVNTPPIRFGMTNLVKFHLKVEVKSYMPSAVRGRQVDVGVWMARIEERSNASPEPRRAM